jgi:Homeodomain-like domain
MRAIAREVGLSHGTVTRALVGHATPAEVVGTDARVYTGQRRAVPAPPDDALKRLYVSERKTLQQIGAEFGVTAMTVSRWLRGAGIAARPKWERP